MEKVTFVIELINSKWTVNGVPYQELDYKEKLLLQEFIHEAREQQQIITPPDGIKIPIERIIEANKKNQENE